MKLESGDMIKKGELIIKIHSPSQANISHEENDRSLVFEFNYEDFNMLFTGDITKSVEKSSHIFKDHSRY